MPVLQDALNPVEVTRILPDCLPWLAERKQLWQLTAVRVTRYKPGRRCMVEYDLEINGHQTRTVSFTLIGKIKAKKLDRATYRLIKSFWRSGFDDQSEDRISVPEPLGQVPKFQMWLQRKVPGKTATDILPTSEGIDLSKRVAEAIYKVHQSRITTVRRHTVADELCILHECLDRVSVLKPILSKRLRRVLSACDRLGAACAKLDSCGIHRDFYADQLIVDDDRLYLIDFDVYSEGSPALDVGNFLAHIGEQSLRTLGDVSAMSDCEERLVEQFVRLNGEQVRTPIHVYATLSFARHIYLSTQFTERRDFTERLLQLCEQRLAG